MALTDEQIADIAREAALAALAQQPAEPDTGPMARIETTLAVQAFKVDANTTTIKELTARIDALDTKLTDRIDALDTKVETKLDNLKDDIHSKFNAVVFLTIVSVVVGIAVALFGAITL